MLHGYENIYEEEIFDYQIREMTKADIMRDDLGLNLATRYYDDVDDFVAKAEAVAAYSNAGETMGQLYALLILNSFDKSHI